MAITSSAKKAHRSSLRKREFNVVRAKAMKDATKGAKKAMSPESLSKAFQAIDKAAKRGIIKKNAAARKKSRLVAAIRKTEAK
jgi:small subunit ribosomal protein S20